MARTIAFEWHGKEYTSEQKTADWYWALGIISTAVIIICILFGNFLLGLVVLFATIAIALEAAKHSRIHRYTLTEHDLIIDDEIHPYASMLSYSVLEYLDESLPPSLSIKTNRILTPHLLVPLPPKEADEIFQYLLRYIPHEPHEVTLADHLIALFRF